MGTIETNVDCMKYRNNTHIAKVDIEIMQSENKETVFTIKKAFFANKANVNGRDTDAYIVQFVEDIKDMVANTSNRNIIAKIVKSAKNLTEIESRNIANWAGVKIRLSINPDAKYQGKVVGGIIVDDNYKAKTIADVKNDFAAVKSRKDFDNAMRLNMPFLQNPEIKSICTELSAKYPKTEQNETI